MSHIKILTYIISKMFSFKNVLLFLLLISNFAFLTYTKYLRNKNKEYEQQLIKLKSDLLIAQSAYQTCQQNYTDLLKTVQLQEREYKKKITELLKMAQKPTKQIDLPKDTDITDVQISEKDCKQMAKMIDQYLKLQNQ